MPPVDAPQRLPVTVLVPTLGRPTLAECVDSLLACRPGPDEILLVVQGDERVATEVARRYEPGGVRVLHDGGSGVASSSNRGLEAAKHGTILVTHDDCTVDPDWVAVGARLSAADPDAIITGRVLPDGDPERVPSCKTDPLPHDYTGRLEVGALYPNNMVLPQRSVLAMGGFDEQFPRWAAEDCDLCYRWLRAGGALRYEPEMVVHHRDWRTREELERLYVRYARSQGALYGKHLARGDLRIARFLVRDLRTGLWGWAARRRGRPRWTDWSLSILPALPGGVLYGLRHSVRASARGSRG